MHILVSFFLDAICDYDLMWFLEPFYAGDFLVIVP
jgi:hypothetical protein